MDVLPDEPVVVLIATALAAVLILVEAALPTFGVAGAAALGLAVIAVLSTGEGDTSWWPLSLVVLAVAVWCVLLVSRRTHRELQLGATLAFAAGSIGYGIAASDIATVIVAVIASIALPLTFPRLAHATRRVLDQPAQSGMEALVGRHGDVVAPATATLPHGILTVRVDGSRWNARSDQPLEPGTSVVVIGFTGTTLLVALEAPAPR